MIFKMIRLFIVWGLIFSLSIIGVLGCGGEPAADVIEPEEESAADVIEPEEESDVLSFGEIAALTGELTEAQYKLWLPHHMWLVGDLFLEIGFLMEGGNPDLREEDRYEFIIRYCRDTQDIMGRAWSVRPPADYEDLHQNVLDGFAIVDEAMDAIIEGIEQMDESKIVMAEDKIEKGFSDYLEPIMETIDDWEYWDL